MVIATFQADFDRLLFVSIVLVVAEAFVNCDCGRSISHEADFAVESDWETGKCCPSRRTHKLFKVCVGTASGLSAEIAACF